MPRPISCGANINPLLGGDIHGRLYKARENLRF